MNTLLYVVLTQCFCLILFTLKDVFAGSYSELNTQHPQDHDTVRFNGIPNNQYPRNGNSYAMSNDNFEHNRGHLSNSWRSERPEGWRNECMSRLSSCPSFTVTQLIRFLSFTEENIVVLM